MGSFRESLGIMAGSGGSGGGVVGRAAGGHGGGTSQGEELCCRGPEGGTPTSLQPLPGSRSARNLWGLLSHPAKTGSILLEMEAC